MEYRAAESHDDEAVRLFLAGLGWRRRVRDPDRWRTLLEHSDRAVVAWDGGRVVGFARALFYRKALDRDVKKPHERPSIGVLLCATKDSEVVEYALSRTVSAALVAE
jgi:hypothetical protein